MGNFNHTGHPINVMNLEKLLAYLENMGDDYDPVLERITIVILQALLLDAQEKMQSVKDAFDAFDRATNAREIEYADIKKLATRLVNALIACGASKQTIADAKTINRKIQGGRAGEKIAPVDPTEEPELTASEKIAKNISVSQLNIDFVLDNFIKLVTLLSNEPKYIPNEVPLQVVTMQTKVVNLKKTNSLVIKVTPPYKKAMADRDIVLYTEDTGLVDTSKVVKSYCLSVLESSSDMYKNIKHLAFKNF